MKTRMHITGKTLLNGVQKKKKRPAPAVGKKKKTMLTFCLITVQFSTQFGRRGGYQKHRVDTASFLTTEEAAVPPAPATECNLSLQGGFLSSASPEKKKKISESWGSPSIFHDQWVFLPQHLRLHFGALDNSIRVERWCVCQHLVNILTTHYTLSEL